MPIISPICGGGQSGGGPAGAEGAGDLRPLQTGSAERGGGARAFETLQLINKNRQQIKEDDYIKRQKLRG